MHFQVLLTGLLLICFSTANATTNAAEELQKANSYLNQGQFYLALQEADLALKNTSNISLHSAAYGIKGNILLTIQRYSEAQEALHQALELTKEKSQKASYANSLGVLYLKLQDKFNSQKYFQLASELIENDPILALKIKLNQIRTQPENVDSTKLRETFSQIKTIDSSDERVRYFLNLAAIAQEYSQPSNTGIIQRVLENAYTDSADTKDQELRIEVLNSLAAHYESQEKKQKALALSEQASLLAGKISIDDLLIQVEWRKGRIYHQLGRDNEALVAYGRAVDHVQAIRRDIPVSYEDGKSSFRKTLEPVYLGYTDQLLKKAARLEGETKQQTLIRARQTIEQLKQSELEDFLGSRCLIEGMQRDELDNFDTQAAILYPILLQDRLELLVSIGRTIHQYTSVVNEYHIQAAAQELAATLRNPKSLSSHSYRRSSENLYRWIIAPIEKDLTREGIKTLVVVPDGVLRLVPFSALFDGEQFLLQKYAISTSPAMSLLGNSKSNTTSSGYSALLAGVSKPGSVIEKLPSSIINAILQIETNVDRLASASQSRNILSLHSPNSKDLNQTEDKNNNLLRQPAAVQKLQEQLSLPGVETELSSLNTALKNTTLLNEQFTVGNFNQQITNNTYDIVHIASHGLFSSDAESSFLMAFDDIIKLDNLQTLLKKDKNSQRNIQLLTLSACETAEGDDRAPLGFSGAALKANALSALGSLWPISDEAAAQLMTSFYKHLTSSTGKAESLRQAQLELLKSSDMNHPFFWSPFILVGHWL